ncbi:MAG: nitroreductase [Phycisphaeraceae bacterium]|nr:MAG: nitroreductase [Phycisphaeraceae bacterium]
MAHVLQIDTSKHRKPDHQILDVFPKRWSPRAMSAEPVSREEWSRLLEAARWSPSSYNEQPWRFVYAFRDTAHWSKLFDLLVEANQAWAQDAGVLALIVSKKTFSKNNSPNAVHVFDAGSAWQSLALQGISLGLVVHGMAGFDWDRARKDLNIPDDFSICAMLAVGKPGDPANLPEGYREMEQPSPRKPISEWSAEGKFPG